MKTAEHMQYGIGSSMAKRLRIIPLVLLGLCLASTAGVVNAQSASGTASASVTREQVKMERDEFLKTHRYDTDYDTWVMKPGSEPPAGMKSRDEVKGARNEFLRNNRWDEPTSAWVSLKGAPREMSSLSREQVRSETRNFNRTHRWDDATSTWVEEAPRAAKKPRHRK